MLCLAHLVDGTGHAWLTLEREAAGLNVFTPVFTPENEKRRGSTAALVTP